MTRCEWCLGDAEFPRTVQVEPDRSVTIAGRRVTLEGRKLPVGRCCAPKVARQLARAAQEREARAAARRKPAAGGAA